MAAIVCVSGLSAVSADHQLPYDEAYRFTCGPSDHASADRASGHIRVHAEISGQEPAPDGREIGCASITFLEGGFDVVPGGEYEVTARLRFEAGEWAPRTEIEPRTPAVLLSNEEAESRISVGMTPIAYGCWTDEDCANGDGPYSHDIVRCQPYPWCEDSDTLSSPPQVGREFTMTSVGL